MKILYLIPSLAKGGAERLTIDICNELQNMPNIHAKLITFHETNTYDFLTEKLDWEIIPSKVSPSVFGNWFIDIKNLQKSIDLFQPDIIHSHLFESEMVLSQIHYPKAKFFVHFHDNMSQLKKMKFADLCNKKALTNRFEKSILLKSYNSKKPHFIAISNDSFTFITDNLPTRFRRTLLYNAIDVDRFTPKAKALRKNRMVTIGSLVDKKGHDLAIQTIAELHQRGFRVSLDILGDGPNLHQLKQQVEQLNLTDYILFHGNVDFPEEYLWGAKVYVHTASYEPFGLVLLEAMAAELPVVCTNGKGNKVLIENGKNGFMVEERDPLKLANSIELLLNDEKMRGKMGAYAQDFAKKYDIKNYVDKLLEIYQR
jgi:glycosyltransferase involved in cell wall biosynthesis